MIKSGELIDLVRFLCANYAEIDKWAYEHVDVDALSSYPVVQGTSNQIRLARIGAQKFDPENVEKAVKWIIENE